MSSKRLAAFVAFLSVASALFGACGDSETGGGLFESDAGIGGVGPFTGNGGSNPGAGAGGEAGDAGQSTVTLARDDAFDLSAEAASTVPAAGVLQNDDVLGAEIVTRSLTTRLGGSVQLALDGSFVYTPPADPGALPRVDDFTYTLSGPEGESSATVLLTLFGTPTAVDDYFGTTVDTALVLEPAGVLENDDPRGAAISSYDATSTAGGSVVLDGSGAFVYVPLDGFVGEDSFQYTLTSVAGESTALVVVQVGREPLAADDAFVSSKGQRFSPVRTVLENDSLGAPAAQIVSFGGGALGGSAGDHAVGTNTVAAGSLITVRTDGTIVFVPEASFVGTFQFLYRLENDFGTSEGSVSIEVHEAPLAVDDDFDLLAGSTLSVGADDANALLANDVGTPAPVITTFGGGTLGGTVAEHSAGTTVDTGMGSLTVNADGSFSYVATAEASGELRFDYHIENAAGNDEGTVLVTVAHAPAITSADTLTLQAGMANNLPFALEATGTPEPAITVQGELPDGVTFSNGSLIGTADTESGGTYEVTVTAQNGVDPDDIQLLTITVETQAVLTGDADATFTVGTGGSYLPTLVGGVPSPTLSLSGTLPDGLVFNAATGEISGIPAQEMGGTYLLEITANNGIVAPVVLALTLEVLESPEISSADSAIFEVGTPGSFTVVVSSNPESTLSVLGTLPTGVTFNPATGVLSGTPASGQGGEHLLAFEASNGVSPDTLQDFTLTVNEAPGLTGGATASFIIGTSGTYTATATGFPAPTLSFVGALPAGLSFNAATGTISGTPGVGTSGSYPVTIGASNGIGTDASLAVTVDVSEVSSITSANATTFTVGALGAFQVTATGTPAPALSLTGTLPTGVTFSTVTGVLSGIPDVGTGGTYVLTIGADNSVGVPGTQSFTLTVEEAPSLTGAATVTFVVGQSNTYSTARTGFPLPTLGLTGALPDGLSFDANAGTISGTADPGTGGTYSLTLTASNGVLLPATVSLTLTVEEGGAFTSDDETTFTVGTVGTFTVTASGTPAPTLSVQETLPSGITFTPGTGELAGTPAVGTGGTYTLTFEADNGIGSAASQTFTLTINEAPALTGAATTTFVVGTPGSYTPALLGFPAPTLSLTGSLPSGLSFDSQTGAISGTAQAGAGGSYPVTIGATNGIGSAASLAVTITVNESSQITSGNATTFTVGSAGSFAVTATGTPASTFSLSSGSLPSGVTLSSAGLLSGTPAASTGGTYPVTISATNGVGPAATQSFTLTVNEAPGLSGAATTTFQVAQAGSYSFTSSGFPAPTLSLTGSLPSGLSFSAATGTISGTPGSGTAGSYPVTIGADNGVGSVASLSLTITVTDPATITSANATTFTVGSPGSFSVTASGTPAPTLSQTGTLPTGVTFSAGTGLLSGTPAAGTGGTYSLTFGADNGVGSADSQSFTLTVNEAPALSGSATTTFVVGLANSYTPTFTGFPSATFGITGSLPSGLSFSTSTGVISGTAQSGTGGSYPVTISANNGVGSAATLGVTISVTEAPAITSANSTTFVVGTPGSFTVTASGTPGSTFSVTSGSLPNGVTLGSGGSLAGTPGAGTGGTYSVTLSASNGVGSAATQSFTLTVNEAPALSGSATTTFVVGPGNNYTPTVTGFPAPTLGITGSLPSGIAFSTTTGALTGTAQAGSAGTYPVTISASNGVGSTATLSVTITVNEAPSITSSNSTSFIVGTPGSFTVTATGSPAPTFSVTSGSLPSGVTLSSGGSLSGTAASGTGGTYPITLSASNGVGSPGTMSFTLTVFEAPSISGTPPSPVDADAAYSHSFTLSGFPAPTTSVVAGTLPTGLTLSSAGALTGTPTVPGTFSGITVRADNSVSSAEITFSIVVNVAVQPPVATNDSFAATGNIAIDVPVGSTVLGNDTLNTATLTGFGPTSGTATAQTPGGTSATAQGGTVTLAANGSFSYDPPAGVTGSDSFAYTLSNAGGSSVGTVTITISNRVWFVDAGAAGGGNGKASAPFQALTSVTSTASGDVIYAFSSVTPYAAKTLSAGQRLLGQGITVNATHLGFTLAPLSRSTAFGTAGSNSSMRTLTLASNVYVRGFDVAALSGTKGLVGSGATSVDIAGMAVSSSNATVVDLASGSGTVSLRSVTGSGGANAILLTSMTGSFTITGDGGNTANNSGGTISGTSADAVRLNAATNVSISSLGISSIASGFYGVHGNSIDNLSLQGVTTSGGTQGLMFEDNNGTPANLTGTVVIRNCSFSNHTTLIGLRNEVGTISSFILENNSFSTSTSTGILLQIRGTASVTDMSVKGNTFTSVSTTLSTNAFNLFVGTNTTASTTLNPFIKVTFENNTFTGSNGIPIRMRVIETDGTLHAIVRNNTVSGLTGTNTNAMRVDSGNSSGNSIVCLQVQNNSFTPSGSALGIAVRRDTTDSFGIVGLTPSPSSVATDVTSFINAQNPGNTSQVVTGATAFASGYTSCTIP